MVRDSPSNITSPCSHSFRSIGVSENRPSIRYLTMPMRSGSRRKHYCLLRLLNPLLSPWHVEHNFALMVPPLQSLMSLFGLFQRKHLIEVDRELARVDELGQFGQLSPIRAKVEQVRINGT